MQLKSIDRTISKKKLKLFLGQIFLIQIYLLMLIFQNNSDIFIEILKWSIVVQFLYNFATNYFDNKWIYNVYGSFLALLFLFNISRVVLDLLGIYNFSQTSFFSGYNYDDHVVIQIMIVLLLALVSLNIGFLMNSRRSIEYIGKYHELRTDSTLVLIGKMMFYLGLVPQVYKILLIFRSVIANGYLSLFLNPEIYSIPVLISFLSMFYAIGFYFCHVGKMKNRKELKLISIIYIGTLIIEMLIGKRGPVLSQIIILLWFYTFFYGKKLAFKKLITIGLLMIVSSQLILGLRASNNKNIFESFSSFFYEQGVSVQVIGYVFHYDIDEKYEFDTNDLFRPLVQSTDKFLYKIQGREYTLSPIERMNKYNNYSMIIANYVNSQKFRSGFGIGGNYLAEVYLIYGYFGIVIFNIILGYLLSRIESYTSKKKLILLSYLFILPEIIYLPRSYIFEFMNTKLRLLMFLFIAYLFTRMLVKNKGVMRHENCNDNA